VKRAAWRSTAAWVGAALLLAALDQWSKRWVSANFAYGEVRPVTDYFNVVLVHNRGAAFSFLSDAGGWQRYLFAAIGLIAAVGLPILIYRARGQSLLALSWCLILGGALGNLWDRVVLGYVVDFLDFHWAARHWPAFNVADIAISCGAAVLIADSFRTKAQEK
jgi:signal peptidase II